MDANRNAYLRRKAREKAEKERALAWFRERNMRIVLWQEVVDDRFLCIVSSRDYEHRESMKLYVRDMREEVDLVQGAVRASQHPDVGVLEEDKDKWYDTACDHIDRYLDLEESRDSGTANGSVKVRRAIERQKQHANQN